LLLLLATADHSRNLEQNDSPASKTRRRATAARAAEPPHHLISNKGTQMKLKVERVYTQGVGAFRCAITSPRSVAVEPWRGFDLL
jgi:hypothetical protein